LARVGGLIDDILAHERWRRYTDEVRVVT